jgi:hypothetical protein
MITGCGCNGDDVVWGVGCGANGAPLGYVPEGIAHGGPCTDAAAPVIPCDSDASCPEGWLCGFEISLACSATAECVPIQDFGMCNCVGVPACACDGTTEYLSCCGSYASKPVAHEGACTSADAGN